MKCSRLFFCLVIFAIFAAGGCSSLDKGKGTENPDAEEILALDPDADIFQFDDVMYKTGIDWVDELTLTKDQHIGEIQTTNDTTTEFQDGMANKLPVGTKIFSAKERGDILIVELDGKIVKYLAIVEG